MRRLAGDRRGVTAVEFALIAPFLISLVAGSIQLTIGLWSYNALQQTVMETARCVAIGSSGCASAPTGCGSSAAVCYAITVSGNRGVPGLTADQVTVEPAVMLNTVSFTRVTITSTLHILTMPVDFSTSAIFPNPTGS